MRFDSESHLAAAKRCVSLLERDGKAAGAITLARSYATTIEDLWDAVTNADRIPRWFAPVSGELRPGGRYQLEGNAGGVITACVRLSHFALTWEFGDDTSWVDVRVSEEGAGHARLALTHTAQLSDHWDEYGPGAAGVGWEMGLLGLAIHLLQPNEPRPDDAAFAASPDGKSFIAGSSEKWGQASVGAGTDPVAARAAARRTTAFYTGEPVQPA